MTPANFPGGTSWAIRHYTRWTPTRDEQWQVGGPDRLQLAGMPGVVLAGPENGRSADDIADPFRDSLDHGNSGSESGSPQRRRGLDTDDRRVCQCGPSPCWPTELDHPRRGRPVNHDLNPEAMHPDIPGMVSWLGSSRTAAIGKSSGPQRRRSSSDRARGQTRWKPVVGRPHRSHDHRRDRPVRRARARPQAGRRNHHSATTLRGAARPPRTGEHRTALMRRTSTQGARSSAHVVSDSLEYQWSDLVAAADLLVLGSSSGTAVLLDVLAAGRPVVAPADPAIAQPVVPAIVGLVYRPGDVSGMTEALRRLVSAPAPRREMGGRARQVARRHHLERQCAQTVR